MMMPMLRACLALAFLSTAVLISAQCPSPVQIPIRNVSLGNQQLRRGAALSVGTPPQNFAFQIETYWNNTYLYDVTDQCSTEITAARCETERGGVFREDLSSSWSTAVGLNATGAPQETFHDIVQNLWGSDFLAMNSTYSLPRFPLSINRLSELKMNTIGLGRNSSLLNALQQSNVISSRTWGLFWGFAGIDTPNQLDGSLVLGGYDAAKVAGPNVTQNFVIDQGCESSMIVTIADVIMNLPGNKNVSIMPAGRGSAMQACISPVHPVLTMPADFWSSFIGNASAHGDDYANRSYGINLWGTNFPVGNAYAGDLTFTIAGLQVRIPNQRLVVPDYTVDARGQISITNESVREVLINPLFDVNKNDMPILGHPFLSSSYLFVDDDRQTFTIWRNNPTADQQLVSVGADASACPSKTIRTDAPRSPPSASSSSPRVSPTAKRSTPSSTIVGVVLGSLVILSCVAAAILLLLRRKQRRAAEQRSVAAAAPSAAADAKSPLDSATSHMYDYPPTELPHNAPAAQELGYGKSSRTPIELPSNADVARMMPTSPRGYR